MTDEMTLNKYKTFVHSENRLMIPRELGESEQDVLALSNALGGEVGELQNIVKKIISKNVFYISDHTLHDAFALEAGDALWYLFRLIQQSGFTVDEIMQRNIEKLTELYEGGTDKWRK